MAVYIIEIINDSVTEEKLSEAIKEVLPEWERAYFDSNTKIIKIKD